jgi:hypothetical protein
MKTLNHAKQLQERTKKFAVCTSMPLSGLEERSCTCHRTLSSPLRYFVGAIYRAACRARSAAGFTSKISIVAEETDEMFFWLELLVESTGYAKDGPFADIRI